MVSEHQVYTDLYYVWLGVLYWAMYIEDLPLVHEARVKVDHYRRTL